MLTAKSDSTKRKTIRTSNKSRASLRAVSHAERPERISLRLKKRLIKGRLPTLSRKRWTFSNALYGVANQMESTHIYEGAWNKLDEFRDGGTKLLGYAITRICDLVANRNQDVRAALGQAQGRLTIVLERYTVSTSSATNKAPITLTSTNSMASQIFKSMFPAVFSPGTGASCKRSTPAKSAS